MCNLQKQLSGSLDSLALVRVLENYCGLLGHGWRFEEGAQGQLYLENFIDKCDDLGGKEGMATVERREIVNAILYVLRSGCPWRLVPHDLPAWGTVYWYFRRWRDGGIWDQVLASLRMQVRTKQGRNPEPSAAIIDSQSIKTSAVRGPEKGYDAGKKNLGQETAPAR